MDSCEMDRFYCPNRVRHPIYRPVDGREPLFTGNGKSRRFKQSGFPSQRDADPVWSHDSNRAASLPDCHIGFKTVAEENGQWGS